MPPFKNTDDVDDPYRAIRVGDAETSGETTKWGHLLTRFMRVLAVFWLLQGLAQWYVVLTARSPIFDTMPASAALAIIFFSVLDLVAGVGLWLATPWGGVLWLLIASAQIFVAANMPRFFAGGYWLIGVDLVLIALYFALTFEAGRDFEAQKLIEQFRRGRSATRSIPANQSSRPDWWRRLFSFFGRKSSSPSELPTKQSSDALSDAKDKDVGAAAPAKPPEFPVRSNSPPPNRALADPPGTNPVSKTSSKPGGKTPGAPVGGSR